ncbi:hypothetical protein EYV94_12225 [Puteibacter caeruleilacunae]|nr:hypothetical protein EYV94_12225 [Puteibacter caeruleilacunae]
MTSLKEILLLIVLASLMALTGCHQEAKHDIYDVRIPKNLAQDVSVCEYCHNSCEIIDELTLSIQHLQKRLEAYCIHQEGDDLSPMDKLKLLNLHRNYSARFNDLFERHAEQVHRSVIIKDDLAMDKISDFLNLKKQINEHWFLLEKKQKALLSKLNILLTPEESPISDKL